MLEEDIDEWPQTLKVIQYAMNTFRTKDLPYSPYQIVYGKQPQNDYITQIQLENNYQPEIMDETTYEELREFQQRIQYQRNLLARIHKDIKQQNVDRANKKRKQKQHQVGDKVLLIDEWERENKLLKTLHGPFEVTKVIDDNHYDILVKGKKKKYNTHRIRPFYERSTTTSVIQKILEKGGEVQLHNMWYKKTEQLIHKGIKSFLPQLKQEFYSNEFDINKTTENFKNLLHTLKRKATETTNDTHKRRKYTQIATGESQERQPNRNANLEVQFCAQIQQQHRTGQRVPIGRLTNSAPRTMQRTNQPNTLIQMFKIDMTTDLSSWTPEDSNSVTYYKHSFALVYDEGLQSILIGKILDNDNPKTQQVRLHLYGTTDNEVSYLTEWYPTVTIDETTHLLLNKDKTNFQEPRTLRVSKDNVSLVFDHLLKNRLPGKAIQYINAQAVEATLNEEIIPQDLGEHQH